MELNKKIESEYNLRFQEFEQTRIEALFIVDSLMRKTDIKLHSIQSRVKTIGSIFKKIDSLEVDKKDKAIDHINDIVGLRIICLFLSDIAEIGRLINNAFSVMHEDNKLDGSEISSFGYFSVHFLCKLTSDYKGARYDNIKNNLFEIQVRTISMDAWANISHYLDYKSDTVIPKELKRDFFALSGLFYVADTHFEMFFNNKKENIKSAKRSIQDNIKTEIDYETVKAYLNNRFKDWNESDPDSLSELVKDLIDFLKFKTISELDEALNNAFKKQPLETYSKGVNQVGIVRLPLRDLFSHYNEYLLNRRRKKI